MIALSETPVGNDTTVQERFLAVYPQIYDVVHYAFHTRPRRYREELMANALAHAWIGFTRLLRQGKDPMQFPTALAKFAAKRAIAGRPVGHSQNYADLTSAAARGEVRISGLEDRPTPDEARWKDLLCEKKAFPPPDVAAMRVDFAGWMDTLPPRDRQVAETLAMGEPASEVARRFNLSAARISQLRCKLAQSWLAYQSEPESLPQAAA